MAGVAALTASRIMSRVCLLYTSDAARRIDRCPSRGLGDVYKRQEVVEGLECVVGEPFGGWAGDGGGGCVDGLAHHVQGGERVERCRGRGVLVAEEAHDDRQRDALLVEVHGLGLAQHVAMDVLWDLSLIHISEPTRRTPISYAVFCLKKK